MQRLRIIVGAAVVVAFALGSHPLAQRDGGDHTDHGIDRAVDRAERTERSDAADRSDRGERPDHDSVDRRPAVVDTVIVGAGGIKAVIEKTTEALKERQSEWDRYEQETATPEPTPAAHDDGNTDDHEPKGGDR